MRYIEVQHITNIFCACTFMQQQGKYEQEYERSEEFQQQLKLKVRELLTDQEWRRRKMQMRVCFSVQSNTICFVLTTTVSFQYNISSKETKESWHNFLSQKLTAPPENGGGI